MDAVFQINPDLDIPIYQQLVDKIRIAVKQGSLAAGHQLPTVQELAQMLGVARGTIKRAYDELEREGLVDKIQGRGTFICYKPVNMGSRKDQAMAAIDSLLDQLESMGFSNGEVNIFLDLKLRQRTERFASLKVAVLECNPENLSQMADQLRDVGQLDVCSYLVDSILSYPYTLAEDMDLIVTTTAHAHKLESVLPDNKKLVKIALRPNSRCLSRIIKLRSGSNVGILTHSARFGKVLLDTCETYNHSITTTAPETFSQELNMDAYLADKDVVLVPKDYEKHCLAPTLQRLQRFAEHKHLIPCSFEMDEGSFLYLEERIKRALEEKPI